MRFGLSRCAGWFLPVGCLAALTSCDRVPTHPTPPPSACQYAASPAVFTPCMQVPVDLTMAAFATPGCQWSVSPTVPWISVTAEASGTGSGRPQLRIADNWDAPREGKVVMTGALPGQTVSVRVAQAGCVYGTSRETIEFSASGGIGTFDVVQQSLPNSCGGPLQNACVWSAETGAPWITITSSMPRIGDDLVVFTVASNTGSARIGDITVRDQIVHIVQAGR
jgi:hypothetical protein